MNYRPIPILSVVGKVLERIGTEAISHRLDENVLLSDQQFAFMSGRSTAGLLMVLSRDWQDSIDNGLGTLVIVLDIAGTFCRVWHASLLEKLRPRGI